MTSTTGKLLFNTNLVWRINRPNEYLDSRWAGIEVNVVQIGRSSAGFVRRSSKETISNFSTPTPTKDLTILQQPESLQTPSTRCLRLRLRSGDDTLVTLRDGCSSTRTPR